MVAIGVGGADTGVKGNIYVDGPHHLISAYAENKVGLVEVEDGAASYGG